MHAWFVGASLISGCVVVKEQEPTAVGTGEVEVSWQIASSGCEAAGVTEVAVEIGGVGGSYDCAAGSAVLTVPSGTHDLFLAGYDASDIARYGGESPAVTVIGGQAIRVPTVVLGALPASVTATWSFDNGFLCSTNNVEEIEMIIYDNDFIEDSSVAPCDSEGLTISDIRAGDFVVSLLGRDASQQVIYSGEAQVSLEKGDNEVVHIQLLAQ
jgi:hypothetical protein